ncbi:hypothetical protein Hanom_Chr04g00363631 [Helianthus anomalus]
MSSYHSIRQNQMLHCYCYFLDHYFDPLVDNSWRVDPPIENAAMVGWDTTHYRHTVAMWYNPQLAGPLQVVGPHATDHVSDADDHLSSGCSLLHYGRTCELDSTVRFYRSSV